MPSREIPEGDYWVPVCNECGRRGPATRQREGAVLNAGLHNEIHPHDATLFDLDETDWKDK